MIVEKPQTEPSMDEILASIRKIISTDGQNQNPLESHPYEQEDILDLTDVLPEEPEKTPTPGFHINDLQDWSLSPNNPIYLREPVEKAAPSSHEQDSFLSQSTVSETMQAFHVLNTLEKNTSTASETHPQEGQPLEALIKTMLKPLLKEWLDTHLPSIVRSVVTQQVEKIVDQKGRD